MDSRKSDHQALVILLVLGLLAALIVSALLARPAGAEPLAGKCAQVRALCTITAQGGFADGRCDTLYVFRGVPVGKLKFDPAYYYRVSGTACGLFPSDGSPITLSNVQIGKKALRVR